MPRGDKSNKEGPVENIKEGASKIGEAASETLSQAWKKVNKMTGGGKKHSSSRGNKKGSTMKSGHKGRTTAGHQTSSTRSAAAKKAARTRARNRAGR
jgi:hypothetical protein